MLFMFRVNESLWLKKGAWFVGAKCENKHVYGATVENVYRAYKVIGFPS